MGKIMGQADDRIILDMFDPSDSEAISPSKRDFGDDAQNNSSDEKLKPSERDFGGIIEKVEKALNNYQDKDLSNYKRETAGNAQGARDVMASIQNITGESHFKMESCQLKKKI